MTHTHSDRLERWLGPETVRCISRSMRDFYWPIPMHGVPGVVHAMPGGDFTGEIRVGSEISAVDRAVERLNSYNRERRALIAQHRMAMSPFRSQVDRRVHAFTTLSAVIAARTGGKGCDMMFSKTGISPNAIGNAVDLWSCAGQPAAGAAGGAAPGGTIPTKSTTGALSFVNAVSNANTSHFVTGYCSGSVASNTLLLYDRLFMVAKTMNSVAIEGVTGVPTRYQSQVATDGDYIGGNFCFPSVPTTVLAGTAHTWQAGDAGSPTQGCTYYDQAGALSAFQSIAGVSACSQNGIDLVAGSWFIPLAAGDVGVGRLSTMQCNALVATGTVDFVLGHSIAFLPCPVANMICIVDGINTAFNLATVYDNACLALIEMPKPATTATTYRGQVLTVSE